MTVAFKMDQSRSGMQYVADSWRAAAWSREIAVTQVWSH